MRRQEIAFPDFPDKRDAGLQDLNWLKKELSINKI
jgi:hypothetical protein